MKKEVVVLGGGGAVGGMLTGLLRQAGIRTVGIDNRVPYKPLVGLQMDLVYAPLLDARIFERAVAVIFALPEDVAVQVLPRVLQAVGGEALIVPTCSVQGPFHAALKTAAPTQPWLGINPMFSPSLEVRGRPVVMCLDDLHAPVHWLETLLSEAGLDIKRMSVEQHDQAMALCQALPHAAVIAFGMALAKSGADLAPLLAVAPPPMRTMLALLSRILCNPVEVYWDIQRENTFAAEQRESLAKAMGQLSDRVHGDEQHEFANELIDIAQTLGAHRINGAEECQRLFSSLNQFK
ncbi:T-protein [compost metagenome]